MKYFLFNSLQDFIIQNIFAIAIVCFASAATIGVLYLVKKWNAKTHKKSYAYLHNLGVSKVKGEIEFFYELPQKESVRLSIHDLSDNELIVLEDTIKSEGEYPVSFNTKDLNNGDYFYRLKTSNQTTSKKFTIEN